jgi:tetratricopeptide (TPR) repeat protein
MFAQDLLSVRDLNVSLSELAKRREALEQASPPTGSGRDGDLHARLTLLRIREQLAAANKSFYARQFQQALDGYLSVQTLAYSLLQPSLDPDLSGHPGLKLPMDRRLFGPLLKAGLGLVDTLSPLNAVVPPGSATAELPADIRKQTQAFTNIGVTQFSAAGDDVNEAGLLGIQAAQQGQWSQAAHLFTLALKAADGAHDPAAATTRAALQMNLGVAAVQSGDLELGTKWLSTSMNAFKAAEDLVGQAQATMNLAAAATKKGAVDEAAALFDRASGMLSAAEGHPIKARPVPSSLPAGASSDPGSLLAVAHVDAAAVTLRLPSAGEGWVVHGLTSNIENAYGAGTKQLAVNTGSGTFTLTWAEHDGMDDSKVVDGLYRTRIEDVTAAALGLRFDDEAGFAVKLPHLYYFVLPVAIGDCHHELGSHDLAVTWYTQAASYEFINTAVEAPNVWGKTARSYLSWGNDLYRQGQVSAALDVYTVVIPTDPNNPGSLYSDPFAGYGAQVLPFVRALDQTPPDTLSPTVTAIVLEVRNRLRMIEAGLDFWGHSTSFFPIFKFDYLHSVASYFAQQAVQAERDYINFTARGEDEQLTRQQLQQSIDSGDAQVELAEKNLTQSRAERDVAVENADLAALRLTNAQNQRTEYADVSYETTALDAASVFASGPSGYAVNYSYYSPSEGHTVSLSGSGAYKVMEQAAWRRGMLTRRMELDSLDRTIAELGQNRDLAKAQVTAADLAVDVAAEQKRIAELHRAQAQSLLDSFESQTFTPEVWFQLGNHLRWLSDQALARALAVAKKMQDAYELETGFRLNAIKNTYTTNVLSGLLSADYLLADIDYFTVHRITNTRSKDVPIKQQLSLATLAPAAFEVTFKSTGRLEFETSAAMFDRAHPGSYLRKIKKVEVVIEGLLPPGGVSGTLKNSGISRDRKIDGAEFLRLQPRETLYLSDYSPRSDVIVFQPDQRVLDVFENCGVATGWTLHVPPDANDVDYRTISDVKVILYYTAQHDEELESAVRATLPTTGESSTGVPVRLLFPDEFYSFLDTGEMTLQLSESDLARNQVDLKVRSIALRVRMQQGASAHGLTVRVANGAVNASATTDASGTIRSDETDAGNPLNAFVDAPVAKPWTVSVLDADNPDLTRSDIRDVFLYFEYGFTYRS